MGFVLLHRPITRQLFGLCRRSLGHVAAALALGALVCWWALGVARCCHAVWPTPLLDLWAVITISACRTWRVDLTGFTRRRFGCVRSMAFRISASQAWDWARFAKHRPSALSFLHDSTGHRYWPCPQLFPADRAGLWDSRADRAGGHLSGCHGAGGLVVECTSSTR